MEEIRLIEVKEEILADNDAVAKQTRVRIKRDKTFLLNLMSSPGAGKTSLITRAIKEIRNEFRMGVIEADIESMVDSEKVASLGIRTVQIKTGGFCHVDASMVQKGLDALESDTLDLVILENVGNLVCPAEFDTGAIRNAMILSVPEGDDKPLKYPLMFSLCDLVVVNKIDFLEVSDFDRKAFGDRVVSLNSGVKILDVSCKTGEGIPAWANWLREEIRQFTSG
jgi:hydrogenase nickel incorporation protein HypB